MKLWCVTYHMLSISNNYDKQVNQNFLHFKVFSPFFSQSSGCICRVLITHMHQYAKSSLMLLFSKIVFYVCEWGEGLFCIVGYHFAKEKKTTFWWNLLEQSV